MTDRPTVCPCCHQLYDVTDYLDDQGTVHRTIYTCPTTGNHKEENP